MYLKILTAITSFAVVAPSASLINADVTNNNLTETSQNIGGGTEIVLMTRSL